MELGKGFAYIGKIFGSEVEDVSIRYILRRNPERVMEIEKSRLSKLEAVQTRNFSNVNNIKTFQILFQKLQVNISYKRC